MRKKVLKKGYFYSGLIMVFLGLIFMSYSVALANSSMFVNPLVVSEDAEEFLEDRTVLFAISSASLVLLGTGVFLISKSRAAKGQAAMEFLMTYGWAILAAIIAIGVLAYFGVFNVALGPPDFFVLGAPFSAVSSEVVDAGAEGFFIRLEIKNGFYEKVDISNITADVTSPDPIYCEVDPADANQDFPSGSNRIFDVVCPVTNYLFSIEGQKLKADLEVKYLTPGSQLEKKSTGQLLYTIG